MYKLTLILFAFFSLVLPILAVPVPAADGQSNTNAGDGTWYQPGLGNCGWTNSANDAVVAISKSLYDQYNGNYCKKSVHITYQGKSASAMIADSCPGCAKYDLDMSPAVFKQLAPLSDGRIKIQWTMS